jgi:two-component system sensor histidine kinase BaeS
MRRSRDDAHPSVGHTGVRLSIGLRLFLAALLASVAVAALGLLLVRWRLLDGLPARSGTDEMPQLDALADVLSERYRQHRDWSFLPPQSDARKRWLRDEFARSRASRPSAVEADSLGYRIGLLDRDQHAIAGVVASPVLVAFASIDTRRRAIVADGETVGHLVLAKPESADDTLAVAFLLQQQHTVLLIALAGLGLCAMAAALLAAQFRRPIAELAAGARRLGEARFDTRLPARRRDELGDLARVFNGLAERLDAVEQSRRRWLADTSHELRTPLSILRGQLEALQDGVRAATPGNVALLLREVMSLSRRVDELDELAHADAGQLRLTLAPFDAWALLCDTADTFVDKFRSAALSVVIAKPPAHAVVNADADRLRQVFVNLLENAVRYTDAGGTVALQAALANGRLRLTVDDSAPGVGPRSLARLGERFFRAEASRERQSRGLGLGLSVSRTIVEAHGGRLMFAPSPRGGLRAIVELPLRD